MLAQSLRRPGLYSSHHSRTGMSDCNRNQCGSRSTGERGFLPCYAFLSCDYSKMYGKARTDELLEGTQSPILQRPSERLYHTRTQICTCLTALQSISFRRMMNAMLQSLNIALWMPRCVLLWLGQVLSNVSCPTTGRAQALQCALSKEMMGNYSCSHPRCY